MPIKETQHIHPFMHHTVYITSVMIMKCFSFPLLLMLLLTSTACEQLITPKLKVDQEAFEFPAEGGMQTLHISSNTNWTASHDWLSSLIFILSPSSGSDAGFINIIVEPNPTSRDRVGAFFLTCNSDETAAVKTIEVRQKGAEPFVSLTDWKEITLPAEGGKFSVELVSNCSWMLDIDTEGIQFNVTDLDDFIGQTFKKPKTYLVEIQVPANPGTQRRTIHLQFYDRWNATGAEPVRVGSYQFHQN